MSGKISREEFKIKLNNMISQLRNKIVEGEIPVGDYLPSELILADEYGLSKNSVRKGLEELVAEGLIVKKSRIGNMVVSSKPFDQIILRVGYYPNLVKDAKFPDLIRQFEEANPYIKVQTIALPFNHYKETVSDFIHNDMVDVVTINQWDYADFQDRADSIFESMEHDRSIYGFLQSPFSKPEEEDAGYVRPFAFSPIVLCYNKEHFDKKGLPYPDSGWKWDEALEAANQLMVDDEENRTCGLYFHPLSVNRWPIFLLQNRIEFSYDPSGSVEFPVTGLIESVNFIKKLFDEQGILQTFLSDSDRDAEQLFLEQKVSMIVTSYFSLNEIKDHSIPYDIAPLPYLKDAQTLLLIIGLAINKNSMKKEAAKRFVDFMADEAAQETIRKETLSIPAMKKIAEKQGKSLVQKPSRYHLFRETIPTFRLYSDLGLTSRELSELRNELRIYLSDLMDDKIFLQRVTAKLSELNINTHV